MDLIEQLSTELTNKITAAAPYVVGVQGGQRLRSGILWRTDVVLVSEQMLADNPDELRVVRAEQTVAATVAGRDIGTNVAVLKLATALDGSLPQLMTQTPPVGALALVLGANMLGKPTGRLAMVHAVGEAWHSMAGGRIDALIRLDTRLGADEGGPVLSSTGGLLGMSTSGPRGQAIVIPTATLNRVVEPLLSEARIARGWLGVGLQPVMIPESFRQSSGQESGLMVVSLASGAPAETGGLLPGDIVLDVDGAPVSRLRALAASLGPDRIGQPLIFRLLRAGAIQTITVTIATRPSP